MNKKLSIALIGAGTLFGASSLAFAQSDSGLSQEPNKKVTQPSGTTGSAPQESAPPRTDSVRPAASTKPPVSSSTNPETPTR